MAKKYIVDGDTYRSIDRKVREIFRQLDLKTGTPLDPEQVDLALQDIVEGKFNKKGSATNESTILRLISGGKSIMIDACDGSETITNAKDTFKSGIDSDFKNLGTDKPGQATEETAVKVHEMVKDATFAQIFGSLGTDLDKLCLTQHQIKKFCKKHANWLRTDGYGAFFLFKVEDQYFVAHVLVGAVGLNVRVYRLGRGIVWFAESLLRVVVPQLISQAAAA
jgi:hypothetical protein